ncbi:MAG: hypothetical protein IJ764_03395 [Bacteroidales bacterium]|nr:hypothetical protein [Bacteroidales bacterium]
MKNIKYFFLFLISCAMFLASCEKESNETAPTEPSETTNPNDRPDTDSSLDGCLSGKFSVSEDLQIQFSQGNLQYQPSTQTWRFAENQYDYIGTGNANMSASYEGWIDHFGWGTSGWAGSGANAYMPYATTAELSDYFVGGSHANNLTGDYADADWGVHNAISNGGNKAGLWRTLTASEWNYLFKERSNAEKLHGLASVCGHCGVLLLPDDWQSNGIAFNPEATWTTNKYEAETWQRMQQAGAVFVPAAGYRTVTTSSQMDMFGLYWSSTANSIESQEYIYALVFSVAAIYPNGQSQRFLGLSVRLVHEIQ